MMFSHRHAVLHDVINGRSFMPLANLTFDQAPVEIYNSPLSEAGVGWGLNTVIVWIARTVW